MGFKEIDNNTLIHRPNGYETKGRKPAVANKISKFTNKQPLSNNSEYSILKNYINSPIESKPSGLTNLIKYFKTSGELIAIIDAFVTDILSDGYEFEGKESNVKRATEFFEENGMDNVLYKTLIDTFIYGNGFMVMNFVSPTELKEIIGTTGDYETKEHLAVYYELKEYSDEVAFNNMNVQHLPACTVSIYSKDKFGNDIRYKQVVDENSVEFTQDEVIQIKDLDIDGKFWGYSRLYALKAELQTMVNTKDYIGRYFDNNGTPDMLFIAKELEYGTEAHKDFVAQLQSFKKAANKRKNLLALSDIDVKELNKFNKDMQFESLLHYLTSLYAMTFQMPPSRYGSTSKATAEEAGLSNQGYYRNISFWQDKLEKIMYSQFLRKIFNVKLKFHRGYKEDESREVQIQKTKTDVVEQRMRLNLISKDTAARELGIVESDRPSEEEIKAKEEKQQAQFQNQYMQGQKKEIDLVDEAEKKVRANKTPKKDTDKKKL